jgi:hypothetical protein
MNTQHDPDKFATRPPWRWLIPIWTACGVLGVIVGLAMTP